MGGRRFDKCIVAYFDIVAFSPFLSEKGSRKTMNILLEIWDWIKSRARLSGAEAYLFSDCGFLVYPLDEIDEAAPETTLKTCFQDMEHLLNEFLKRELFLKGSIVFGPVKRAPNLLLGNVVYDCVRLESECPGPFLIAPILYINELLEKDYSHTSILFGPTIRVQYPKGPIQCKVLFPLDRYEYQRKLEEKLETYAHYPTHPYATFWENGLSLLKRSDKEMGP